MNPEVSQLCVWECAWNLPRSLSDSSAEHTLHITRKKEIRWVFFSEPCLNPGPFVSFGACASEPGSPGTSRVRRPDWRMTPLYYSCWRGPHPEAVTVSPTVYLLESHSAWWWLLFHLGLPVSGVTLSQGDLLWTQGRRCCSYNRRGAVLHCLWWCATGVGEGKGELNLGCPHFRLLLSLDEGNLGPAGL